MRRRTAVVEVVLLVGLLASAACAPMQVHTYMPRGADLQKYRTYAWAPPADFATGDPRLDNNTLFLERLKGAVERQLTRKGWLATDAATADVVIHFHARIDQRLDLTDTVERTRASEDSGGGPLVYDAGTLLLDFIERRSNTLVWRGWAEGSVDGVIDNQAWMNEKVDTAVERIFAAFPVT
jgi:hypothetical protein